MLKNIKIVYILALVIYIIYCGIMKENFILVDGNNILMDKDKNQVKDYNLFRINIDLKDIIVKVKEMDLEFLLWIMVQVMLDNGQMV